MANYKQNCIKCAKQYDTDDPDPYYCGECFLKSKEIAKEIDKKMAMMPKKKVISDLQQFDELVKTKGQRGFVDYKDLGITL